MKKKEILGFHLGSFDVVIGYSTLSERTEIQVNVCSLKRRSVCELQMPACCLRREDPAELNKQVYRARIIPSSCCVGQPSSRVHTHTATHTHTLTATLPHIQIANAHDATRDTTTTTFGTAHAILKFKDSKNYVSVSCGPEDRQRAPLRCVRLPTRHGARRVLG